MNVRKKFFDFEYSEVLDIKTRELIRVACAVSVHCSDWLKKHFAVAKQNGASEDELKEAMAYGMMAPGGRAKNFAKAMLQELAAPDELSEDDLRAW